MFPRKPELLPPQKDKESHRGESLRPADVSQMPGQTVRFLRSANATRTRKAAQISRSRNLG